MKTLTEFSGTLVRMATEIVIPQAGESVTEGVVQRWVKGVGEYVKRDETILEIETGATANPASPCGAAAPGASRALVAAVIARVVTCDACLTKE